MIGGEGEGGTSHQLQSGSSASSEAVQRLFMLQRVRFHDYYNFIIIIPSVFKCIPSYGGWLVGLQAASSNQTEFINILRMTVNDDDDDH